jgi:predicted aspartyl protease
MLRRVSILILGLGASSVHALEQARFPYEEIGGHLFVRGEIGDSGPRWLTLDTGAGHSVLDAKSARSLGIPVKPGRTWTGAGGAVTGEMVQDVAIRLAGVEIRIPQLDVSPLDGLRQALGRDVDLVLGHEFWSRFIVEIDPIAQEIRLHDPKTWTYDGAGESIAMRMEENCPYVKLQLQLPEAGAVDIECIIDTGSGSTLILQPAFVEAHRLRDRVGKTLPLRGGGLGGQFGMSLARLPSLKIGRFEVERPLVLLPEGGDFAAAGSEGNIGGGLLRRFTTIYDYAHNRLILEPNAHFTAPDEHDMSGAGITPSNAEPGVFLIARVREGSAAEAAGVRVGDRLVAIDGRPTAEMDLEHIRGLMREDGRERALRVRRAGEFLDIRVKLRRMI